MVVKEVAKWRFERENTNLTFEQKASKKLKNGPAIHTISFNCNDNVANTFLSQLAADNNGRFHAFQTNDVTAQKFVHSLTKEDSDVNDYSVSFQIHSIEVRTSQYDKLRAIHVYECKQKRSRRYLKQNMKVVTQSNLS